MHEGENSDELFIDVAVWNANMSKLVGPPELPHWELASPLPPVGVEVAGRDAAVSAALSGVPQLVEAGDVDQCWAALERAARCWHLGHAAPAPDGGGKVVWRDPSRDARREAVSQPEALRHARRRAGLLRAAARACSCMSSCSRRSCCLCAWRTRR